MCAWHVPGEKAIVTCLGGNKGQGTRDEMRDRGGSGGWPDHAGSCILRPMRWEDTEEFSAEVEYNLCL